MSGIESLCLLMRSNNLHAVAKDGYEGVSDEEELKNATETSPLTPEELEKKKNN